MSAKTVLSVKGMTCASCAQGITRHLNKKGYSDVHVFYETGQVEIDNLQDSSLNEVISEINSLGYKASTPESGHHEHGSWSVLKIKFGIAVLFTIPLLLPMIVHIPQLHQPIVQLILSTPVVIIGIMHFGKSAWGSLKHGVPNMDVLISIGSLTAYIYSIAGWMMSTNHEASMQYLFFETSATIITLVLLGNLIEENSLKKTTSALEMLTALQPQKANRIVDALTEKERTVEITIDLLNPNDLVLIRTGERIPADGTVYEGAAVIDEASMTGESLPVEKNINDKVMAGTIVEDGSIKIFVEKTGAKTILSSMIELVRRSAQHKPSIQRLGDKISAIFVPAVILIAVITFLLSYFAFGIELPQAIMHSIAVLVVSCPCAMGLATPTAVSVGIGRAAKSGILIKGGDTLERLSETQTIVFDKTGTLTTGKFSIKSINYHAEKEVVDYLLYTLEQYSNHPIANSISEYLSDYTFLKPPVILGEIKEEKGKGIIANDKEGNQYILGSYKSINRTDIESGHQVYLIKGNTLLATVDIEDEIREDAKELIEWFKSKNIKPIMLSGDSTARCKEVAIAIGIEEYYGEQLPTDKTEFIEKASKVSKVTMVGDGINDAAALSLSNVGIAMGTGAVIAMETSDIVLINERHLSSLKEAFNISALTITTIKQNLFWAFFYNVLAIPVAAIGLLSPMIASLSMAFSDVIVIGNSLRLKIKR